MSLYSQLFALTLFVFHLCSGCSNPEVTSKSFTTLDATVINNIGYVCQFKVKCKTGSFSHLYAELDGNVLAVPEVAPDEYQLSWTEQPASARSGNIPIRIYDEDGYVLLKRAARAGDEILSVPYLFTVVVNHPGAFNGPWLKSEFLAAILASVVAYFALSLRSKLLS